MNVNSAERALLHDNKKVQSWSGSSAVKSNSRYITEIDFDTLRVSRLIYSGVFPETLPLNGVWLFAVVGLLRLNPPNFSFYMFFVFFFLLMSDKQVRAEQSNTFCHRTTPHAC